MIEKKIEAKIVDKLNAFGLEGFKAYGLWQPTTIGNVKDMEHASDTAVAVIKTQPLSFDTFGISEVELNTQIVLTIRVEKTPDGSAIQTYAKPISDMLSTWNMKQSWDELTDLVVEGFNPGGVLVNGGTGPDFDIQSKIWTIVWNIQIKGTLTNY